MCVINNRYQVICETFVCEEGPYQAYGIRSHIGDIHDISQDKGLVEDMAQLFNRVALDPGRAGDIVERMLP